jgi:hypothetical protein
MFFTDTPFKGCHGRSNHSSIMHVVSLTPHAFLNFFANHRCFVYDFHFSKLIEHFFVHAVSMTPQEPRTDVLMKKKPRVKNLVTLSL